MKMVPVCEKLKNSKVHGHVKPRKLDPQMCAELEMVVGERTDLN